MIGFIITFLITFSSCDWSTEAENNSDSSLEKATEQLMTQMNNMVGMPEITEFYERKLAKQIFELRDDSGLITYAYFQNLEGMFVYLGQCVGFGLPYSVQYTSPEKLVSTDVGDSYGDLPMPQADPNGLFMPDGLSATWLMYINPDTGDREVIYTEPSIVVTQSKLPRRLCVEKTLPMNY